MYGLDIGPAAIRAATDDGDGPTIDSVPPVVMPVDDDTLATAGLSRESDTVQVDGTTYAIGTAARNAAETAEEEPQPLFVNGLLAEDGPADATVVLDALIDDVIGDVADGRLCYTTVGTPVDTAAPTDTHHEAVTTALADRGVDLTPISQGFAVVYDQLAADNYTGLGVCLGTQTTSATVAYYGVPAVAVSIAKGREWIVDRVADETGHEPAQVTSMLEDLTLDPDVEAGGLESALAEAYDELVAELIDAIRDEADENDVQRGLSIPVAIAGEGAVEGLEFLVGGRFDAATVPFSVRDVRLADLPAESAARGALAAARDDVEADEAMSGFESAGADTASAATESAVEGESPTNTELAFDEFDAAETTPDPTDDAIEKLFDRLANRDDEIQSVREDLEYIEARTAAAEDVAALDDRLESFADELADLEAKSETHATETDVASLDADLEALSDAFDALEADIDEVNETLTAVEATAGDERSALDDRLVELAADVETVTDRTATIDEALNEVRTDLDDLVVTAATEASLETLEGTVSDLTDDIAGLERDLEQRGTRLDGVAGRLEELRTRLDSVAGRLEEHVERTDARFDGVETTLDEEIEAVDDELDTIRETVDTRIARVRDAIDDIESTAAADERVDGIADELAHLETAVDDAGETISAVEMQLDDLETRTASTETVDALTTDLELVEEAVRGLESALDSLEDKLEGQIDDAVADIEARIESTTNALEADLAALESTIERIDAESVTDDELDALRDALADTDDELDAIATDLADLTTTLETVDDRIDDVERTFTADLSALEAELERETDALGETISAIDDRVDETEHRLDDYGEQIDETRRRLNDHDDRIDDLASSIETAEDTASDTAVTAIEADLEAVDDRLVSLRTAHDDLAQAVESSPDESALEALESELDALDRRIDDVETHVNRDEELEALRSELEAVRADATATPALPPSIVAGGGGAGVVAGAIAALSSDATIGVGAAVVGLVLIAVAGSLAR
ncbi:chromosome segregation ATPase [Haloarchaeobius amylolyticus]|uniref:Chromosome segregation ATPase n=1 Tax=Haloarchaeobius amylolyticus TaxID=1198296 RepID=A0ABD6BIE1_9EURY